MKILVVDDDPALRDLVRTALERAGFAVITAADGQSALTHARREAPALIVLDIGLPEMDGLEVCRTLRATSDTPILFLTARDDEVDRILGLELGADDYVTKPFSPRELAARVKAIVKRSHGAPRGKRLDHGALTLEPDLQRCAFAGAALGLTATEMALLAHLMRQPAAVVPRNRLIDVIYGRGSQVSDRTLDSHLRNLRAKLAAAGCVDGIETVHGIGIRLGPCRA